MRTGQSLANIQTRINNWWFNELSDGWRQYQNDIPDWKKSAAQKGTLIDGRYDIHKGLRKAESSAAVQLRSGKIGFNHFLFRMKVPGIVSARCPCGWSRQDVKHVLLFCSMHSEIRPSLIREAGTTDFNQILGTIQGAKAAARWLVRSGILNQFSLAREQHRIANAVTVRQRRG